MDMTEEEIIKRMQALQSLGILPHDQGRTSTPPTWSKGTSTPVTNLGMMTDMAQTEAPYKSMSLPNVSSPNIDDRRGMPGKWNQKFHDALNADNMKRGEQPRWIDGARGYNERILDSTMLPRVDASLQDNLASALSASGVTPKDPLSLDEPFVTNQFPASGKDEWHYKEADNAAERQSTKTPVSIEEIMKRLSQFNFGVE